MSSRQLRTRRKAKKDTNHNDIVGMFIGCGCSWLELSNVGGALDGVLGVAGIDQRVEIKNPEVDSTHQKLTPAEEKIFDEWKGRKPVIVMTPDDAITLVHQLRKEACTIGPKMRRAI